MILYIYTIFQLGALEREKVGYLTNDKRCLMETCRDWRMRVNVWRIKDVNDMIKMMMANDDVECE